MYVSRWAEYGGRGGKDVLEIREDGGEVEEEEEEEEEELCAFMCHGNSLSLVVAEGRMQDGGDGAIHEPRERVVCSYVRYVNAGGREGDGRWGRRGAEGGDVAHALGVEKDGDTERRRAKARIDICVRYLVVGDGEDVDYTTTDEERCSHTRLCTKCCMRSCGCVVFATCLCLWHVDDVCLWVRASV